MRQLSHDKYLQSRAFVAAYARPLDRALCAFTFDGGPEGAVAEALAAFQTDDGGFGRALEPDFRLDDASVLATTLGLQYAVESGLPAHDPMVARAVAYLTRTFDPVARRWQAVPREVNDAPHAPWWTVDPSSGRCEVEGTWANPNAEALAYLWWYGTPADTPLRDAVTQVALSELATMPVRLALHDFLCYARLAEALPADKADLIRAHLHASLPLTVDHDPASWVEYGAKPVTLASSPHSPFAAGLGADLDACLDFEVHSVGSDGAWRPNWTWGDAYPNAWRVAEREWAGLMTVQTLRTLAVFGRVDGVAPAAVRLERSYIASL